MRIKSRSLILMTVFFGMLGQTNAGAQSNQDVAAARTQLRRASPLDAFVIVGSNMVILNWIERRGGQCRVVSSTYYIERAHQRRIQRSAVSAGIHIQRVGTDFLSQDLSSPTRDAAAAILDRQVTAATASYLAWCSKPRNARLSSQLPKRGPSLAQRLTRVSVGAVNFSQLCLDALE